MLRIGKVLASVLFILCSNAFGIIYVDVMCPNDPGTGTFSDPFRKIQDAIDSSVSGDVIEIRPGVYTGEGNYNLDPNGKSITISSINSEDTRVIADTIIDPNRAGQGFDFHGGEDANCVISGLTIRNGYPAAGYHGGNIYCYASHPTIRNCIIKDGYATGSGGGIYSNYGDVRIVNCTLIGNSAEYYGGGISSAFCAPVITGCTIRGNTALLEGGGIDCGESSPDIINCIISNNESSVGGGINCYYAGEVNIVNCDIVGNSATDSGGGLYCQSGGGAVVRNSIVWANEANESSQIAVPYLLDRISIVSVRYSDVQGGRDAIYKAPECTVDWYNSNINSPPYWSFFDVNSDSNSWDFHLQSSSGRWDSTFYRIDFNNDRIINLVDFARLCIAWLKQGDNLPEDLNRDGTVEWSDLKIFSEYFLTTAYSGKWVYDEFTSPCIDSGDPNSDWSNEPWPNGKRINMGAYGGTNQASKNGNPADFSVDGLVNFVDFAEFSGKWLNPEVCIEDLTSDSIVEFDDLWFFAENWLWQKE